VVVRCVPTGAIGYFAVPRHSAIHYACVCSIVATNGLVPKGFLSAMFSCMGP
jgi:hypothetical protein